MDIDKSLPYFRAYDEHDKLYLMNQLQIKEIDIKILDKANIGIDFIILLNDSINENFYIEYKAIDFQEITNMINIGQKVDVAGRYMKSIGSASFFGDLFDNTPILGLDARLSYWEGSFFIQDKLFQNGKVLFDYAILDECELNIFETQFRNCSVSFYNTLFGKNYFGIFHSEFENSSLSFYKSKSESRVQIVNTKFRNELYIDLCKIYELEIEACVFYDLVRITSFTNSLSLSQTVNWGKIQIDWDELNINKIISNANRNHKEKKGLDKLIYKDFLLLKENYHNQGQYEWEDAAYRAYMKYHTKSLKWLSKKGFVKKPFNWLFGVISGYGTRVLNIILTCIAVIIVFGFGYKSAFLASDIPLWKSMYFSTITFLTIGYGNLNPMEQGFTRLQCFFTGAEGFLGLLLMSLVTITIVRKILR